MEDKKMILTARLTGIWYLLLAVSGILGFMIFHPNIFISEDPSRTLKNLTDSVLLPRIRLIFELLIILSQALAAIWFYKLFRESDRWAALTIGIWGTVNSVVIMVSAIAMHSAIDIANSPNMTFESKLTLISLLLSIMSNAWSIGGLFFGLWLIPMGYVVVASKCMPIWLGRTLMIGGIGYILSTFFNCLGFSHSLMDILTIPATIGEFWMIGYLLIYGIRPADNIGQR